MISEKQESVYFYLFNFVIFVYLPAALKVEYYESEDS